MDYLIAFLNFGLVIVTAILALITFKYVAHTRKMADVMMKDYELRIKPLIDFKMEDGVYSEERFRRDITIRNIGFNKIYTKDRSTVVTVQNASGQPIEYVVNNYNDLMEIPPGDADSVSAQVDFQELKKLPIKNLFTDSELKRITSILESKKIKVRPSTNLKYPNFDVFYRIDIAGPNFDFETKVIRVL